MKSLILQGASHNVEYQTHVSGDSLPVEQMFKVRLVKKLKINNIHKHQYHS